MKKTKAYEGAQKKVVVDEATGAVVLQPNKTPYQTIPIRVMAWQPAQGTWNVEGPGGKKMTYSDRRFKECFEPCPSKVTDEKPTVLDH